MALKEAQELQRGRSVGVDGDELADVGIILFQASVRFVSGDQRATLSTLLELFSFGWK